MERQASIMLCFVLFKYPLYGKGPQISRTNAHNSKMFKTKYLGVGKTLAILPESRLSVKMQTCCDAGFY